MSTRTVRSAVLAAAAGRLSYAALRARPPGGAQTWSSTNHRGEPITLFLKGQRWRSAALRARSLATSAHGSGLRWPSLARAQPRSVAMTT